ncbi:hypothetical protein [Erythrobacter sp. HKB08]|uniref:hypothetical protein n=1 Tax=Erythrobacter sp. HKB08 TaxID=2502843 RepID=UPI0010093AA4|nr:hypothetical protein [Erythrobacter sp. HKB08]
MKRLAAAALALSLGGCITPIPDISQSRSPCMTEPGGWCDFVREAAVVAYPYAMLSSNAYDDEDTYTELPPGFERRENANDEETGLAYHVYDHFEMDGGRKGKLLARIIAFRGTDFGSRKDIFSGSFGTSQIELARKVLAVERGELARAGQEDVPIELTGHSLGGALATQLSIEDASVRSYAFNTSPLFQGDPATNAENRMAIAEYGEFLRILRRYSTASAADSVIINCRPSAGAGEKHGIRSLADCLTWIAAYEDAEALALVAPNAIAKPEVECGAPDKAHPGLGGERGAVCTHSPRVKS